MNTAVHWITALDASTQLIVFDLSSKAIAKSCNLPKTDLFVIPTFLINDTALAVKCVGKNTLAFLICKIWVYDICESENAGYNKTS